MESIQCHQKYTQNKEKKAEQKISYCQSDSSDKFSVNRVRRFCFTLLRVAPFERKTIFSFVSWYADENISKRTFSSF